MDKEIIALIMHVIFVTFLVYLWVFHDGEKLKELVVFMLGIYPLILYKVIGIHARASKNINSPSNK